MASVMASKLTTTAPILKDPEIIVCYPQPKLPVPTVTEIKEVEEDSKPTFKPSTVGTDLFGAVRNIRNVVKKEKRTFDCESPTDGNFTRPTEPIPFPKTTIELIGWINAFTERLGGMAEDQENLWI